MRTLIGFGASTMEGVGDTTGGGWFARAEKMATERGVRARWINRGKGGNTTADMLLRISTVTAHTPHDVVVILGCNDMPRTSDGPVNRRNPIDVYRANLDLLLKRIKGQSSLFISSFPARVVETETFDRYMAQAIESARNAGYLIWDLYAELKGRAEPYWAPDGVHFNDAGHQYIAEGFLKRLGTDRFELP